MKKYIAVLIIFFSCAIALAINAQDRIHLAPIRTDENNTWPGTQTFQSIDYTQGVVTTISADTTLSRPGLYRCDGSGPYVINANALFGYIGSESIFTNLLSGESIFFTSGSIGQVGNAGVTAYATSDGTSLRFRADSGVSLTASAETGSFSVVAF